jgi:alpha-galactosidase
MSYKALALVAALAATGVGAWDVAATPPMGWNSWDYWHCEVNATILMDTAKAFVNLGLAKAGCVQLRCLA